MTLYLAVRINKLYAPALVETWYKWPQLCQTCLRIPSNHKRCSTSLFWRRMVFETKSPNSIFCKIISAWLFFVSVRMCLQSWEVLLSTLWSELQLTGEGESDGAPLCSEKCHPLAPTEYSCIFILSPRLSSIHYCQLIRCKAGWKTCPKFIKNPW